MAPPQYYQHSGGFSPVAVVIRTAIAMLAAAVVAWVYAYGIYYIPFIYINVVLTALFGFLLAGIVSASMKSAKTRNEGVFLGVGVLVSGFALYLHWAAWVGIVIRASGGDVMGLDVALQPGGLWQAMVQINAGGVWSLFGIDFSGALLWVVWGIEAAIVIGLCMMLSYGMYKDLPFCESCEEWCTKHENVARVWHEDADAVTRAFEYRDAHQLGSFQSVPLDQEQGAWFQCDVEVCESCGDTNTLGVTLVSATVDQKGNSSDKKTDVISNLLLSTSDVEAIRGLATATDSASDRAEGEQDFGEGGLS